MRSMKTRFAPNLPLPYSRNEPVMSFSGKKVWLKRSLMGRMGSVDDEWAGSLIRGSPFHSTRLEERLVSSSVGGIFGIFSCEKMTGTAYLRKHIEAAVARTWGVE